MEKLFILLCLILAAAQGAAQEKRAWEVVYGNFTTAIGPMTMHFISPDTGFVGGGVIFDRTVDGGKTWRPANYTFESIPRDGPTWCIYKIEFWGNKIGYARGADGGKSLLLKTTDGGNTWENIYPKGIFLSEYMSIVSPDTAFFSSDKIIYRTSDGGKTFEPLNRPPMLTPQDNLEDYFVNDVEFFGGQKGVILGGKLLPSSPLTLIVWTTEDGGNSWTVAFKQEKADNRGPYFRTWQIVSPKDWIFQSSYLNPRTAHYDNPYLYATRDGGKTWNTYPLEEDTTLLSAIAVMFFHNPDTGYVCTYNLVNRLQYVYATFDGGKNWVKEPINFTGAGSGGMQTMHFPTACTGYMGGIPYHIFKTTTCGKPVSTEPLAALSLEPEFAVYPCPAPQGKATLAFTLPAGGCLSLALVDPLGRKRTLLPLAYYPPGKNELPIPLPQKGLWLLLVEPENQPQKNFKIWAE